MAGPLAGARQDDCVAGPWFEQQLCKDGSLKALEGQMEKAFQKALQAAPAADQARLRQTQRLWAAERDACEYQSNPKLCLADAYRNRVADLASERPPVTAAPPPVAPPAPFTSSAASPKGLNSWAGRIQANYPTRAAREERGGRVGVRVTITIDGRVDSCSVTSSSGSPDLDEAACDGMTRYARFNPARDAEGNPMPGSYSTAIVYKLH